MTTEERIAFLKARQSGIGGSDIGAIMGVSKWAGPWQVWCDKVYEIDDRDGDDRSRMTGRLLEEAVGRYAEQRTGAALVAGKAATHPDHPWRKANPDYMLFFDHRSDGLECKTAERPGAEWGADGSDQIPKVYELQCRWYMAVTNTDRWYCAVFFKRVDEWRLYKLERDAEQELAMVTMADDWWARHIVDGEEPDLDASLACRRALAAGHPITMPELRVAEDEEERLVREYVATQTAISTLTAEHVLLGNQIRKAIGPSEGLRFTGGRVKWSRKSNRLTPKIRSTQ